MIPPDAEKVYQLTSCKKTSSQSNQLVNNSNPAVDTVIPEPANRSSEGSEDSSSYYGEGHSSDEHFFDTEDELAPENVYD